MIRSCPLPEQTPFGAWACAARDRRRYDPHRVPEKVEALSNNGRAYSAEDTRFFAQQLGLKSPASRQSKARNPTVCQKLSSKLSNVTTSV